ncbi:MAG: YraN family protein [Anaerovibrio sp.]|uniref:YraN family protein n=1 Tax=Anaerovibrio sp. TaxID=1872532 RepID=UPI0025F4D159|nr:YraN family protein [Anaerovibrio sp.]MCR5176467.1 YraN family protein [Anaerovibrio sp.]
MNNKILGDKGEKAAAAYLKNHGYIIRDTNYRTKTGEIDIIAARGDMLVFVEVKTRGSYAFGLPSEAVNLQKQKKIIKTAQAYIQAERLYNYVYRFDVLEVLAPKSGGMSFNLIESAFEG